MLFRVINSIQVNKRILIFIGLILVLPFLSALTIEKTSFKNRLLYVDGQIDLDKVSVNSSFGYVEFYNLTGGGNFSNIGAVDVNVSFYGLTYANYDISLLWDNLTVDGNITTDINITIPTNRYVEVIGSWRTTTDYVDNTVTYTDDNNILQRTASFFRNFIDILGINDFIDRIVSFFRDFIDNLGINNFIDRLQSVFRDIVDNFNLNNIVDGISNFFRDLLDNFSVTTITEKVASFFRSISDTLGINNVLDRVKSAIRNAVDNFTLNNIVERVGSFFRDVGDNFGINNVVDNVGNFFRDLVDNFTLDNITYKLRSVERNIIQFFQMFLSLFTKASYDAWAWTSSVETLTQGQAYEKLRVPYGLHDNWTVSAVSPKNWTNTTKTYTLPIDCSNVQISIDGINLTYSILVNNTGCVYTIINNNTLLPGDTNLTIINYTTNPTTSSEGTWTATTKWLGNETRWTNTLSLNNPSIHDYIDISTNITTDKNAIPAWVNITNSTPIKFTHNFSNIDGNTNWSLSSLNAGVLGYLFYTNYRTDNITLNKTNHNETILGKVYAIWNVTVNANSTRPISNVYSHFNFSDENIVANRLYKCDNGFVNCTEDITNKLVNGVVFSDIDLDGNYDYVEWFITSLNQNQSFQLHNDNGFPIEITISKDILNKPVYVFDNVLWRTTLTMYNPNAFATTKVYKYEFPLGSADIELDDIRKNLAYDPFGNLAPYVTIIDKDQSGDFPDSVYLGPGETKTFIIEYRTESVTLDSSTYFPSHFEVDKDGLIVQILRIKNQAEDNVSTIQYRLPLDYAEDLIVCKGEYEKGCPDDEETDEYKNVTLDTQSSVSGDYTLEIDELESGETMYVTLSYYTPTAKLVSVEKGRRSVQGNLTTFKKINIESQAKFTMGDLRYKDSEIACENVVDILKCRPSGICDIPLSYTCNPFEVKIGLLGMGEEISAYIWHIELQEKGEPTFFDNIFDWFMENIWNGGKQIKIEGFLKYIVGFLASKDVQTGELYIPLYRLIFLGSIIGIIIGLVIWFKIRKKRKLRRKSKEQTKTFI